MITIVLTVSRKEFLEKVITAIELLDCDQSQVDILCIVDGDTELYIRTRNLIMGTKYRNRLTVKFNGDGKTSRYNIPQRRQRISAIHNQARSLINHTDGYVFLVEDDTVITTSALKKLSKVAISNRACAFVEGVELGRWGVPYVGAWVADDIYDPKELKSVENIYPVPNGQPATNIDAGGLYCALVRTDIYKQHTFNANNGLGPDINFGIENRQLGFENLIAWDVPCKHYYEDKGEQKFIVPSDESKVVIMRKVNNKKWSTHY